MAVWGFSKLGGTLYTLSKYLMHGGAAMRITRRYFVYALPFYPFAFLKLYLKGNVHHIVWYLTNEHKELRPVSLKMACSVQARGKAFVGRGFCVSMALGSLTT